MTIKYFYRNSPCLLCQSTLLLQESVTYSNRPLALRGHLTNASFKQCVGILMLPKIDRTHKNYLTSFVAIWFFNEVLWFVLAAMLEDILLPSNMAVKTTFCLYLVKLLIVTLRCAVNVTTSSFNIFLKFKCKNCVQKEVIHNFKNDIFATWLSFS